MHRVVGGVELVRHLPQNLPGLEILERIADIQLHAGAGGVGDAVPETLGRSMERFHRPG